MNPSKYVIKMGRFYELLYKTPFIGDRLVRFIARNIARTARLTPFSGIKRLPTIQAIENKLVTMCSRMGFLVEVTKREPEKFEFLVHSCPYGYHRPDQQGVCDAVMDMDRYLFRFCGGNMVIEESVVEGAHVCRITMHKI